MKFITLLLLGVMTQQSAEQKPAELLPNPSDWRFERLEFPLDFAPDLPFSGFEELRFAPGMFDSKSGEFWTYAFAMKITNTDDTKWNKDRLTDTLVTYYAGLTKAVGKDKKFEMDLKNVSADVTFSSALKVQGLPHNVQEYDVRVKTYDPFVTGKLLTLNMKVHLSFGEMGKDRHQPTVLKAIVSPKPYKDDVWKKLIAIDPVFDRKNVGGLRQEVEKKEKASKPST